MKFSLSLAALAALTMPSADAFTGFVNAPCSLVILSDTKSPYSIFDYRFNKCPPIKPDKKIYPSFYPSDEEKADKELYLKGVHKDVFPLLESDYGGRFGKKGEIMQKETDSESVVLPNDDGLLEYKNEVIYRFVNKTDPVTEAKLEPLFPVNITFWDEFTEVVHAQKARRKMKAKFAKSGKGGLSPKSSLKEKLYPWPKSWYKQPSNSKWPRNQPPEENTLLLDDVAMSVRGEFSNAHQQSYLIDIADSGVDLTTDMGNPFRCELDFLAMPIRMAAINAWSLEMVGPVNFNLKWHFGLCRPEEVAWLIHKGNFTEEHGVPKGVVKDIKEMKLKDATDFTAYPGDGSPMHPSFPAMHSAGSTCSLWVPALYDITPEQYLEALRTDYGVAFARTVAGVHYPQDNLAGLNIGQRVIRERLPKFLSENYGYKPALVADKVNKLSFDWNKVEFTEDGCTIEGKSHIQFLEEAKNVLKKPVVLA